MLSPIGLNVRAQPSKTAPVLGSAAQGATLTVLSHTDDGGGFYQVMGATVTGYITDNPVLSAAGKFTPYSSSDLGFSALYPAGWAVTQAPPSSVVFHSPTGGDSVVVSTAATTSQLGQDQLGYHEDRSETVVVCGVTGNLVTFSQTSGSGSVPPSTAAAPAASVLAERYLAQVHLTLDPQHALGVDANMADLSQLPTVMNVLNSVSFPFPQCLGASADQTTSTAPATTVQ